MNQAYYDSIEVPPEYDEIFSRTTLPSQIKKGVGELELASIRKRGYFLVYIAKEYGSKYIAEVGTAQGYQTFSFAKHLQGIGGSIWSCDLYPSVRDIDYDNLYKDTCTFVFGTAENMAHSLGSETKIDLFFIDGNHEKGAVLSDIKELKKFQSDNCVWIFDDYDTRFGVYDELQQIENQYEQTFTINQSGPDAINPNHMLVVLGTIE